MRTGFGPVASVTRFAEILWADIKSASQIGPGAEYDACQRACDCLHGVRMTHSGSAQEIACTLHDLAWERCRMAVREADGAALRKAA